MSRLMTHVDQTNPLTRMLDNAFTTFDRNKDGKLNADEYQSFYEILKPGIAVDANDKPVISEQAYMARMDGNSDGQVTQSEMQNTGVLMPASLTDESLNSVLQHLLTQTSENALAAARIMAESLASTALTDKTS